MSDALSLDKTDLAMLALLQENGRMTNQELADNVSLTTAPCLRRLKRLESEKIIEGYAAILNPKALSLEVMALVSVSLNAYSEEEIAEFENFVENNSNITECYSVSGEYDFFIKVVARNITDIENILLKQLLRLKIVRTATTNFVLGKRKSTTSLPVPKS
jgi:DNA-binding Lrp family transcriptional regulator